jgi:hypothetical protein
LAVFITFSFTGTWFKSRNDFMKNRLLLALALPLAILSTGCASNHASIGAWRGDHFSPTRSDKIALMRRPNPNDQDARLGRVLTAELKREGFNLVPPAEADYLLAYAVEDDWVENDLPTHPVQPLEPEVTTAVIGPNGGGVVITSPVPAGPQFPPAAAPYHSKGIRLYLYTNPKTHAGDFETAWEGAIDAGQRISPEREPVFIKTLLLYLGQDHVGRVKLAE